MFDANKDYASCKIRKLLAKYPEIKKEVVSYQFIGARQRQTPCVDAKGLIAIVMKFNATTEKARQFQACVTDIAARYLEGDLPMREFYMNAMRTMYAQSSWNTSRTGYVYIASTTIYMKDDLYKVGRTTEPNGRTTSLNTSRCASDSMFMLKLYPVSDYKMAEVMAHASLVQYRDTERREFFKAPLIEIMTILDSMLDSVPKLDID